MASERWTWQLPATADEEGLEGYRVTDVWDRQVGSVRDPILAFVGTGGHPALNGRKG